MNMIPLDPPAIEGDEAREILRVWVDKSPEPTFNKFVIFPRISKDPIAWGYLLVDIARHVANAYVASEPENDKIHSAVLDRIKALFDAEWENPTDPCQPMK